MAPIKMEHPKMNKSRDSILSVSSTEFKYHLILNWQNLFHPLTVFVQVKMVNYINYVPIHVFVTL
jgi:hypothetical protein